MRRIRTPKDYSWLVVEKTEPTEEEKQRVIREDEDIKRRREAFGLY